ncbi:linear gramicidin synthetase subunit D domain protein, partial [Mycobacterium xenopi 4042]
AQVMTVSGNCPRPDYALAAEHRRRGRAVQPDGAAAGAAGATEADVAVLLQALLDRHAMLRARVDDDGAGSWLVTVPDAGSVTPAPA